MWENIEVGYVQGMCDLAAPLLVIFDDGQSCKRTYLHSESALVAIATSSGVCVCVCVEWVNKNCLDTCRLCGLLSVVVRIRRYTISCSKAIWDMSIDLLLSGSAETVCDDVETRPPDIRFGYSSVVDHRSRQLSSYRCHIWPLTTLDIEMPAVVKGNQNHRHT